MQLKLETDIGKSHAVSAFGEANEGRGRNHVMKSFIDVALTAAQIDALNATPIELVPAPGAGKALIFLGAFVYLAYGTVAWAGSSETIPIKYQNASGATVGTITEAFMESTANAYQYIEPVTAVVLANQALVATANADFTTGDSPITIRIYYQVITADLSAL